MSRCAICSGKYHQIPSDGPVTARIAIYAERPGQWEEANARQGYTGYGDLKCLVGPTGKEWNELYLPLAGLRRDEVFVGNTVQCGSDNNRKPTANEVRICGRNHIPEELSEVQPEVVILMGATACSLVPSVDLEVEHGIPFWGKLFDWSGWICPMYHPSLGLHEGSKMSWLLDDWEGFGRWWERYNAELDGRITDVGLIQGERGGYDYAVLQTPEDLRAYFEDCISSFDPQTYPELIGVDTESHAGEQFSVQFSLKVGTGRLILCENKELISEWAAYMNEAMMCGSMVVLHNHPADLGDIESMGVDVLDRFRDTMMEAYQLGLPQGLKALSYRLLGRKRLSWEETVTPKSKLALIEWLVKAGEFTETWRDEIQRTGKKGQPLKPKLVKSKFEGTIKSILNHTVSSETYDPWAKLKERVYGLEYECLVDEIGEHPKKGVKYLDLEELVEYGCLSKESLVNTETGYKPIGNIVNQRSREKVMTYNQQTSSFELRQVTGWHRVSYKENIEWFSVETDISRVGKWRCTGTRYTSDHRLLTPSGWVPIADLRVGDSIYYPGRKLSRNQRQIILGNLLGDGSIQQRNKGGWAVLSITHCERQVEYLRWQRECLRDIVAIDVCQSGTQKPRMIAGKLANPGKFYRLNTIHHPEILRLRQASYPVPGAKRVADWIEEIEPLGLAIWYQDDGTRVIHPNGRSAARFYTNGFPKEDVRYIREVLDHKFGLRSSMFQMDEKWVMAIGVKFSQKFFELIAPFVHPVMDYKLPSDLRGKFIGVPTDLAGGLIEARVIKVYKNQPAKMRRGSVKTAWCIDVAGTHNFCTGSEIAHNCADADCTLAVALELERLRGEFHKRVQVTERDKDEITRMR